jgi:hypothetical protein
MHAPVSNGLPVPVWRYRRFFAVTWDECHGQADHVKKEHYLLRVTENTKYALRVANPLEASRPAGGWPPESISSWPLNGPLISIVQRLPNHGSHHERSRVISWSKPQPHDDQGNTKRVALLCAWEQRREEGGGGPRGSMSLYTRVSQYVDKINSETLRLFTSICFPWSSHLVSYPPLFSLCHGQADHVKK